MSVRVGMRDRIYLALLAGAGTLVAHALAFRLVAQDAHHHSLLLLDTGHGYWGLATPLAMGLALGGVAQGLLSGGGARARVASIAPRAITLQCLAFLFMETLERASVGKSLLVVTEPVVVVGLALQVVVALVATVLLVVLTRALHSSNLAAASMPRPSTPAEPLPRYRRMVAARGLVYGGALLRAPPETSPT